jgi:hypothetical protein
VFSCQRKLGCAVIERRGKPRIRVVARLAPVIQHADHVIRIRRPLKIGLVAREAVRVLQCIVVVNVTLLTLRGEVLPCQREVRCVVVK